LEFTQTLFLAYAASLPLVTLVGVGRGLLGIARSVRAANWPFAILIAIAVVAMLALFAAVAVLWFIAAVSHGPKGGPGELLLLFGSGIAIYLAAAGLWALARHAEARGGCPVTKSRGEPPVDG
jgi:hypothetical protein